MQISHLLCDQAHSLFQSEFPKHCDPVGPDSNTCNDFFPSKPSVSCLRLLLLLLLLPRLLFLLLLPLLLPRLPVPSIFPSVACFRTQAWHFQLAFLRFILYWMFLSSLCLCDTIHFSHDQSKWSYIPLQHRISKLSDPVSSLHKSTLQMQHFTSFILEFAGDRSLLVQCCFRHGNSRYTFFVIIVIF